MLSAVYHLPMNQLHKKLFTFACYRFNVAITRAKALLVVVGNPNLLSLDSHWREFIRYTVEKGKPFLISKYHWLVSLAYIKKNKFVLLIKYD